MIRLHCAECGEPIPNGQAHIRSRCFRQVALCAACVAPTVSAIVRIPTQRRTLDAELLAFWQRRFVGNR